MENEINDDLYPNKNNGISFPDKILQKLQYAFYRHGYFVAGHPIIVLIVTVIISLAFSTGFLYVHMESVPEKLWIPQESDYVKNLHWQRLNFPDTKRISMIMFEADNILTPANIKKMYTLKNHLSSLAYENQFGQSQSMTNYCLWVPALGRQTVETLSYLKSLFGKSDESNIDLSHKVDRDTYCQFYWMLPKSCLNLGIFELWSQEDEVFEKLTQKDILDSINKVQKSATFGYPIEFENFLGGIKRNMSGHIIAATTAIVVWIMDVDVTAMWKEQKNTSLNAGFFIATDEGLYNWEGNFIKEVLKENEKLKLNTSGLTVLPFTKRSFSEVSQNTIFSDVKFLALGISVLTIYVFLTLGKFDKVEMRPILCLFGIISIVLSVSMAFGVCALAGIIYSPIHSILPLLLIGLGVDDMFVVVQSIDILERKLNSEKDQLEVREKIGKVFESAGASITVTSLTDFAVFLIGSCTSMPALNSFCLYAAVGVIFLYIMQITFFLAALTLDQRRKERNLNGLVWCIKHKNYKPNKIARKNIYQSFFDSCFPKYLMNQTSKAVVLGICTTLTGYSIWTVALDLKQEFNLLSFLPRHSYVHKVMNKMVELYPESSSRVNIYMGEVKLPEELPKIKWLAENLNKSKWISSVESWYEPFAEYVHDDINIDINNESIDENSFLETLAKFIYSTKGSKYESYFFFEKEFECTEKATKVKACMTKYRHIKLTDRNEQILAMDETQELIKKANISGRIAVTSMLYSTWETNKYIVQELTQNLLLALISVFVMTSLLIMNLWVSFLVMLCVVLTLVDVMALMSWWGLFIDTVTCVNLVLCVGLSVDYSAHIGLHFMKSQGKRDERATSTLSEIGPPVFNGAFSTFLAFVFLANSSSHVFESFFKIFLGVFIFGVFHGLVFLPVILSIIGPKSYSNTKKIKVEESSKRLKSNNERVDEKLLQLDATDENFERSTLEIKNSEKDFEKNSI